MRSRRRGLTMLQSSSFLMLLAVLFAAVGAAGCASSARVSSNCPTSAVVSPSAASRPVSPAEIAGSIAVCGSVPTIIVSTDGPIADSGVFVGSSVAGLIRAIRHAGYAPCAAAKCWQGRELPRGTIGIASQANPLGCFAVDSLRVTSPQPGTIQVDVQEHNVCSRGEAAAKGRAILLAVPRTALPKAGIMTAEVRVALQPGDTFGSIGTASMAL